MGQPFPKFSREHLFGAELQSISVVGNVHPRRWRWNPFERDLDLEQVDEHTWQRPLRLEAGRLPEHSGNYAIRLVVNHNPRRLLKASSHSHGEGICCWHVNDDPFGSQLENLAFKANADCEVMVRFDSLQRLVTLTPAQPQSSESPLIQALSSPSHYELNGFVWDELDMFDKFQARQPGRRFIQDPDGAWSIEVPLKRTGGIDFRADGVYQFLISVDGEEDFGFASLNDGNGTLVRGSGFSSSHGTSMHSGCTIKVDQDGPYRFRLMSPQAQPRIEVQAPDGSAVPLLNRRQSIQLLGSVHDDNNFDPTVAGRDLIPVEGDPNVLAMELEVKDGAHVVNFAIGNELFLDTMGFGCWLTDQQPTDGRELYGVAWHGKPQEWNILFQLSKPSRLKFTYWLERDEFSIRVLDGPGQLTAMDGLRCLSLVGSFEAPLSAWSPQDPANLMEHLGGGRYQRCVHLVAGKNYSYKYVANRSDWQMVFADYELDGYGTSFQGDNPNAANASQRSLRRYGQLTTHGNPPPLSFTPIHSGPHRFFADVISGGYSVQPL